MSIFFSSSRERSQRQEAQRAIERIIDAARRAAERRREQRYPLFGAVTIIVGDEEVRKLRAFTREISRHGVGLLHNVPLDRGKVVIEIADETGEVVPLATEIVWCQPCGEGWYISGGRFLDSELELDIQALEERHL